MSYDRVAKKYEKYDDITEWELGYNVITKLIGSVKNKLVLDYGCGNAKFSRFLRDHGAKCIAVDPSKKMIGIAKTYNNRDIQLRLIRNSNLYFVKSNSIDAAVVNYVICTIPEKGEIIKILKEIYRCLKRNTPLIILEPNPKTIGGNWVTFKSEKPIRKSGEQYTVYLKKSSKEFIKLVDYYRPFEDYMNMLKAVGFRKIISQEPVIDKNNKKAKWMDEYSKPPNLIIKAIK